MCVCIWYFLGQFRHFYSCRFLFSVKIILFILFTTFVTFWVLYSYCPESQAVDEQERACTKHPERQPWASRKCSIIKSEIFSACHSIISPFQFYENCVHDACGCDLGGDCECLCTAIKAYSDECSRAGIVIKDWRSQNLCPMQCDCPSKYNACASTTEITCQTRHNVSKNLTAYNKN